MRDNASLLAALFLAIPSFAEEATIAPGRGRQPAQGTTWWPITSRVDGDLLRVAATLKGGDPLITFS
jgi:hypothetical protein